MSVVECQPSLLTWSGGVLPYFLSVLPGGEPSAAPLVNLGQQNGTSFSWTVNLTANVVAFLQLRDSTGALGQSGNFTVLPGTSDSCITSNGTTPTATGATSVPTGIIPTASGYNSASGTAASGTTGASSTKASQGTSSTGSGAASSPSRAAAASQYAPIGTLTLTGAAALAFALVL